MSDTFFPDFPFKQLKGGLVGKRIFLTGGTGFFGKWLLQFFHEFNAKLGADVVVLSRDPDRFRCAFAELAMTKGLSFIQGDVRDFEFPAGTFDYVIHAATPVTSDDLGVDSDEMYSIIVDGAVRVVEFTKRAGVPRMLFTSSGAVYGEQPIDIDYIAEEHPCHPITAYGRGKLEAERLILNSGLDSVVARCFAFVGPYFPLNDHYAVMSFIRDAMSGRAIEIKGDGTPLRSYMYGADLVEWLLTILLGGAPGRVYNVGSEETVSIVALAARVKDLAGSTQETQSRCVADSCARPARYVPAVVRARDELGLVRRVNLDEALTETLDFYGGLRA